MLEIRESKKNKLIRKCMSFMLRSIILIGLILIIVEFAHFRSFNGWPILLFIVLGWYAKNRISRIDSIGEDYIVLSSLKRNDVINKNDIIRISKWARFTISERFWLTISYRKSNRRKEMYFFQVEPKAGMIEKFREMGIILKNMP